MFVTLLHIIIFQFPPILRNSMIYVLNGYGSQNNDHCQHVRKERDVVNPDESTNDRQHSRLHGPANFADDFFFRNLNGRKRRVYVNYESAPFSLKHWFKSGCLCFFGFSPNNLRVPESIPSRVFIREF